MPKSYFDSFHRSFVLQACTSTSKRDDTFDMGINEYMLLLTKDDETERI